MAPVTVALDLDDAYPADERPVVRVRPSEPTGLVITVEELHTPGLSGRVGVPLVHDWTTVPLPVVEPGCYRVTVTGEDVEPTRDLSSSCDGSTGGVEPVPPVTTFAASTNRLASWGMSWGMTTAYRRRHSRGRSTM